MIIFDLLFGDVKNIKYADGNKNSSYDKKNTYILLLKKKTNSDSIIKFIKKIYL